MSVPEESANKALDLLAACGRPAWLVGGALRDQLLGRATSDFDVALDGDPIQAARAVARGTSGHAFALSEEFGVWRVVARDRSWQVDVLPLAGSSIEANLGMRDLTINALARRLDGEQLVDPFGGLEDLRAGRLRMVGQEVFTRDPLRSLRLARLACELGFSIDPETRSVAAAGAQALATVAPERVFAELKRIVVSERAVEGIDLLDQLGITGVILPELGALRGVEQSRFHHLDVHAHTLAVLAEAIELERDPEPSLGRHAAAVQRYLEQPLANELNRWQALRFGALLHDIAKPQTRRITPEGRITFIGHDAAGGATTRSVLERLRASERLAEHIAALTRHHLRLGFLVHEMPLSRRAIYGYLSACEPVQVDVTVLSVADRMATRGDRAEEAIAKHLELAGQLLGEALEWVSHPPRPPIRGDALAQALGITPGPELGRVLAELEQAAFAGEIASAQEAIDRARELLGTPGR